MPSDIQSRIEAVYLRLGLDIPDSVGCGLDGFAPLVEHIKQRGGVFVVKWDGERDSRYYTAVVSHPDIETYRNDDHSIEVAVARAILAFHDAV